MALENNRFFLNIKRTHMEYKTGNKNHFMSRRIIMEKQ